MRAIILSGTALLALAGCSGGAGTADNVAAPAQPAPAAPGGDSAAPAAAAASGLPEGLPAYPRMRPGGAVQMGGRDDGAELQVTAFRTDDPPAAVIAFYAEAAERAGFRIVRRAEAGPSTILGLTREPGEIVNLTATATPTGTSVQIMAGRQSGGR